MEALLGLRVDGIEGWRLVKEEITLGWATRRREGWGSVGQVEVEEDGGDDRRVREEREDPQLAAAGGAEQRQNLEDTGEEDGPSDARGVGGARGLVLKRGERGHRSSRMGTGGLR